MAAIKLRLPIISACFYLRSPPQATRLVKPSAATADTGNFFFVEKGYDVQIGANRYFIITTYRPSP